MRPTSVLGWSVGAGALLPLWVALISAPTALATGLLAHVAGLLAAYAAVLLVVLMARVPLLERYVGSGVLTRWHSRLGPLFLLLVLVHLGAAVVSWVGARPGGATAAVVDLMDLPGLVAAVVGTLLLVVVAVLSAGALRRRMSHEVWHGVHLLVYVALVASFAHELAGPDLAGLPVLQVTWTLVHVWAIGLVVRYRVLAPFELAWRHQLRVQAVMAEADDVVSLLIRGRHLDELPVEAGQFFRWRFLTSQTWRTAYPFSLSALPMNGTVRITVKAVGEGSRLIQAIRPGTLVLPEGPSGTLTARRRIRSSVVLIAGGVGITPLRTLFEDLDVGPGKLTLIYRASRPTDVVFRNELEAIAQRRRARIEWLIGPSTDPAMAMTSENLLALVPDLRDRDVYLSASTGFAHAVRTALREAEHPPRQLHEDVEP